MQAGRQAGRYIQVRTMVEVRVQYCAYAPRAESAFLSSKYSYIHYTSCLMFIGFPFRGSGGEEGRGKCTTPREGERVKERRVLERGRGVDCANNGNKQG